MNLRNLETATLTATLVPLGFPLFQSHHPPLLSVGHRAHGCSAALGLRRWCGEPTTRRWPLVTWIGGRTFGEDGDR